MKDWVQSPNHDLEIWYSEIFKHSFSRLDIPKLSEICYSIFSYKWSKKLMLLNGNDQWGSSKGFREAGEKGLFFSGSWGALIKYDFLKISVITNVYTSRQSASPPIPTPLPATHPSISLLDLSSKMSYKCAVAH